MTSLAAATLILAGCTATESSPAPQAAPATNAAGKVDVSSAAFQSKWWNWATQPEEVNPVTDSTGEHCAEGQGGGVWLVAGSFGGAVERQCTMPTGVPIAGPVVNLAAADAGDCADFLETAEGTVSVGSGPQVVPEVVHVEPVRFEFTAQRGNPSGYRAGRQESYGCGIWFSVGPLPAGQQQIVIKGSSGNFSVQATYNLTVKDAVGA